MGRPAARLGDMTAHGGVIAVGCPTVLIGGMPAARLTDMHACPMVTGFVPHVGGPITAPGSPTVLIGGMPAARQTDMATCVGPPDVIAMGCPTVLIGMAGGGGAGGGGGGGTGGGGSASGAGDAVMSAGIAMIAGGPGGEPSSSGQGVPSEESGADTKEGHWIEFEFVDTAGNPISGVPYEFITPDGKVREGRLGGSGAVRWKGRNAGQGEVEFKYVYNARWSTDKARVGEKVKPTADVEGYAPGTPARFVIYERDVKGPDDLIAIIEVKTQSDKVETEWEHVYTEDTDDVLTEGEAQVGYSAPEHYFEVMVERSKARSGLLMYKDYIELQLKDGNDRPIAEEPYILYIGNGEVRKGKLDGNGYKKEENIPPVDCDVVFPNYPDVARDD